MTAPATIEIRGNSSPAASRGEAPNTTIRVSELLSALSYALDLTEGRPMGHSVRSCVIGMRIAQEFGLPEEAQADL